VDKTLTAPKKKKRRKRRKKKRGKEEEEEEEERGGRNSTKLRRFRPLRSLTLIVTRTIRCQRVAFFVATVLGSMRSMLHTTCRDRERERERERERGHALMRRAYRGTMCSEN